MADASNFTSYNNSMPNISVGSVGTTFLKKIKQLSQKPFRYRVVQVFDDGSITYEDTFEKFGISNVGALSSNKAYPSSQGQVQFPKEGEYVDLVFAPEPYSASETKSVPLKIAYWKSNQGALNIWNQTHINTSDQPLNNIVLDPSVPGNVEEDPLNNINLNNMQNAFKGFV